MNECFGLLLYDAEEKDGKDVDAVDTNLDGDVMEEICDKEKHLLDAYNITFAGIEFDMQCCKQDFEDKVKSMLKT